MKRSGTPALLPGGVAFLLAVLTGIAGIRVARSAPEPGAPAPRLFGEDVISTADDEIGGALSPDGKEFFYAKRTKSTLLSSVIVICFSRLENGHWARPAVAPFSGQYVDFGPSFSPDGKRLYFASVRPREGKDKERTDTDIWFAERGPGGAFGPPRNLGAPVNSSAHDQNVSVADDGTLYFASSRPGGKGGFDIYRARPVEGGGYAEPENLGDAINTEDAETQPCIAPDQSFLLFTSGRSDSLLGGGAPYPRPDLYVSMNRDGKWTTARPLPAPINTDASEAYASLSADGRFLFFTSERNFTSIPMRRKLAYEEMQEALHKPGNGLGDVYQVDVEAAGLPRVARRSR